MTETSHKKVIGFIMVLIILLAILVIMGIISSKVIEPKNDKVSVAVTIFPLADIVQNIGGDAVDVKLILDPSASPHTFELTPQKATQLANVDLIFAIGQGLDNWAAQAASISESDVVELDQYVPLICERECDPHYWLSVQNAINIVDGVSQQLSKLSPMNSNIFAENADRYIKELSIADNEIKDILTNAPSRDLIMFHDSWNYFAEAYNLNIRGTFEPAPGREPTPKQLAELHNTVKEYSIVSIYKEPQLAETNITPFVRDLDIDVRIVDPLGGQDNRSSYIELMLFNAHAIAAQ